MGTIEQVVTQVQETLAQLAREGRVRPLARPAEPWPAGSSLVLHRETGLELGHPAEGSLACPLWSAPRKGEAGSAGSSVLLVGPDAPQLAGRRVGLGVLVVAEGEVADPYEHFLDLSDALFEVALVGLTLRSLPSSHQLWCRVSKEALARGFALGHWGWALADGVLTLESVEQVTVLLVTDWEQAGPLHTLSEKAQRALRALVKSHHEIEKECDECDLAELCDEGQR